MGGFNNEIVGGASTLIRKAIQSQNYQTGVSGWTIRKDGTFEFQGGSFNGEVVVTGATSQDPVIVARVVGDTNIRFEVQAQGVIFLGDGANPPTATIAYLGNALQTLELYGPQVNIGGSPLLVNGQTLAQDPNQAYPAAETWHALTLAGSYVNQGAPQPNASYRLLTSPSRTVEVHGALTGGASHVDGTTVATLPAPYRPTHTTTWPIYCTVTTAQVSAINVDSSGNLKIFGCGSNVISFHLYIPLDL